MIGQGSSVGGGTAWLVLTAVAAVLGLAVGYLAYLGYRRQDSLSMLFVATGFLLTFTAPAVLVGGYLAADVAVGFVPAIEPRVSTALALATEAARVIGLSFVLYGLWRPSRERGRRAAAGSVPERDEPREWDEE